MVNEKCFVFVNYSSTHICCKFVSWIDFLFLKPPSLIVLGNWNLKLENLCHILFSSILNNLGN